MNEVLSFFVYSIIFKLLIITTGTTSIILGYRLYKNGVKGSYNKGATIKASGVKKEIILKNIAPGTFFALFGAVLLCFLIFSSSPEMKNTTIKASDAQASETNEKVLRGMEIDKMAMIFTDYYAKKKSAQETVEALHDIYLNN